MAERIGMRPGRSATPFQTPAANASISGPSSAFSRAAMNRMIWRLVALSDPMKSSVGVGVDPAEAGLFQGHLGFQRVLFQE
jgi:hypothetical protein